MATCSREPKQVHSLVAMQGGPYVNRREAEAAIAAALALCVSSSAPPCCGECVERGSACHAVVDEWDAAIGPFYAAPAGGSGWFYHIPVGLGVTFRHVAADLPSAVTA